MVGRSEHVLCIEPVELFMVLFLHFHTPCDRRSCDQISRKATRAIFQCLYSAKQKLSRAEGRICIHFPKMSQVIFSVSFASAHFIAAPSCSPSTSLYKKYYAIFQNPSNASLALASSTADIFWEWFFIARYLKSLLSLPLPKSPWDPANRRNQKRLQFFLVYVRHPSFTQFQTKNNMYSIKHTELP